MAGQSQTAKQTNNAKAKNMLEQMHLDTLVAKLYKKYVSQRDQTLLDTVFAAHPTQGMLDDCLRTCDIEAIGGHKNLMFSYLMREHPELRFSDYAAPRLKGLINFYRFANIKTLQPFSRIGKAMNKAGIPIVICKGAAMKILRPELSRPMGDVDILIAAEHMEATIKLCQELGYVYARAGDEHHTATIRTTAGKDALDIHSSLFGTDYTGGAVAENFHKNIFARAKECEAFGVRLLLPANEDLFFIVLANLAKNLWAKTSLRNLFFALFDCRFLLQNTPAFDWTIVRNNINATHMEQQARLAAKFMDALVPGIIPDLDKRFPLPKQVRQFCDRFVFDEDYLNPLRVVCQKILVVDLKNYPRHYGGMIAKLLVMKKFRKCPTFVRWYLRRQNKREAANACR